MWGKIIIPMYRLWLQDLCGLYGPQCPLSPKRSINLISLSLSVTVTMITHRKAYSWNMSMQEIRNSTVNPSMCAYTHLTCWQNVKLDFRNYSSEMARPLWWALEIWSQNLPNHIMNKKCWGPSLFQTVMLVILTAHCYFSFTCVPCLATH